MRDTWLESLEVEFKIHDERLRNWGFPRWTTAWAAGLDLFACVDAPVTIEEQAPPIFVSTGMTFRIGNPNWCALVLARSGAGHRGLIHGNTVGVVDPDFDGLCQLSLWNRNPAGGPAAPVIIRPGDRIGQLVFTRITRPVMIEVDDFSDQSGREDRSFGSSGT